MKTPFERTTCACAECQAACVTPGYMIPGDWERIAEARGLDPAAAAHLFRRGKGAVVGKMIDGQMRIFRINTITPAVADGQCVFLDTDKHCTVHAVAPFGCSHFDLHMSEFDGQQRSTWGLTRVATDGDYQRQWQALPERVHDQG